MASITIPVIKQALATVDSNLAVSYLSSDKEKVSIFVSNIGIKPGIVAEASIDLNGNYVPLKMKDGAEIVTEGGEKLIMLNSKEAGKTYYTALDVASEYDNSNLENKNCSIEIHIKEFSGKSRTAYIHKLCKDILHRE